jgi:hypothetical protein
MAALGQLVVSLTAETAKFREGLEKATKQAESNFNRMTSLAKTAGAAIVGALSVGAIASAVKGQIDLADELAKTSQKIGIQVEELQKLRYAADLSGVSAEGLTQSVKKLAIDAENGGKAMAAIGVSARGANGEMKSAQTLFTEVAEAISKMGDGTQKTAAAVSIFGKAGADLIPLLNSGADGIKAMTDEAVELGFVMDESLTKAAERYNDNLTRLSKAKDGIFVQITKQLLPALEALTNEMVTFAKEGSLASVIGKSITTVFQTVAVVGSDLYFVISQIAGALVALGESAYKVATFDFSGAAGVWTEYNNQANEARKRLDAFQAALFNVGETAEGVGDKVSGALGGRGRTAAEIEAGKKAMEDHAKWLLTFEEVNQNQIYAVQRRRLDQQEKDLQDHQAWIESMESASQSRLYEVQAKRLKDQEDLLEKTRQGYVQLGEQIGSSIGNNLENAIMTGMKFKDVVRAIIQDMIRLAIQKTIVNSLTAGFGSFFGSMFGGGRALGGPVKAGTSYLVGEKGPELFTPGMSGNITPNGGGGGNSVVVNVNVDGGTKVQDDRGAGALGSAIAAAVRSELVNQRRPGGLLA